MNSMHLCLLLLLAIGAVASTTITTTVFASNNGNGGNSDNANGHTAEDSEDTSTEEVSTESASNDPVDPTPGVGNNDKPDDAPNPQPDRVGSHDEQTSPESNPGPEATDPTLCDITTVEGCSTSVDKNCFGKVISERAQDHKEDPEEGTLGSHSRDPVPELEGNETPRQGIGNQDQGHPSAHGAFNSQFEDEDEQNVIDNC